MTISLRLSHSRFPAICAGFGLALASISPLLSEEADADERAASAWKLGANVGMAMAQYEAGAAPKVIKKYADQAKEAAEELKLKLPPPPEKTGKQEADTNAVIDFLSKDINKEVTSHLAAGKEKALAEIGINAGLLLISYSPESAIGKSFAKVLADRAKKAELPEETMEDLLEQLKTGASVEDVSKAVEEMEAAVTAEVVGEEEEAEEPAEPAEKAGKEKEKSATPMPKKAGGEKEAESTLSEGSQILENALGSMAKATGYNIKGGLIIAKGKRAELTGAFGIKKMDLLTVSPDKKEKAHRIIVNDIAVISKDGDKTWKKDDDTASIALLSNTVTGPISPELGLPKEIDFKIVGEEEIEGEALLHLQGKVKDSKGKEMSHEYWIAKDETLTTVIRRCKIPIEFNDMDAVADITYSDINSPKEVVLPEGAGE